MRTNLVINFLRLILNHWCAWRTLQQLNVRTIQIKLV